MECNKEAVIIIPTLNEEKFIASCLDSVIAQTYPLERMEILVVDGGSCDRTHDIVKGYGERYPDIRLLDNPGRIQSIAFNIGLRESSEPYVIRLDAHASYSSTYIELCVKHLSEHPEYGNVGGICRIEPQNSSLQAGANAVLNKVSFGIGGAAFRVGSKAGFVDSVPFGAFQRKVLEEVGGMREDLARGEDNEINSRIRKAGYKVYIDPEIVSTYYARGTVRESMKQMYANGESIGKLFHVDRSAIGLRHVVPMCFLLSLAGSLLLGLFWHPFLYLFAGISGLYAAADLSASISACMKFGSRYIVILPLLFFLVHCSYGWGTLVGLFKR